MALQIGLTLEDLQEMSFNSLINIITVYTEAMKPKKKEEVKEATQGDIDAFFG